MSQRVLEPSVALVVVVVYADLSRLDPEMRPPSHPIMKGELAWHQSGAAPQASAVGGLSHNFDLIVKLGLVASYRFSARWNGAGMDARRVMDIL